MADYRGFSGFKNMTNPNCQMWVDWESSRAVVGGRPGWNVSLVLKAKRTPGYVTYGTGSTALSVHGKSNGEANKYMEIIGTEKVFQTYTFFVDSEAGADVKLGAYGQILIPDVVSGQVDFQVDVKRNLWGINFNANGGSNAPSLQKKYWGLITNLSSVRPVREGYIFQNWNTSKDGNGRAYNPGDQYGEDTEVTLYAQWKPVSYEITYDAQTNGGTVEGSGIYKVSRYYQDTLGDLPVAERSSYKFIGWNTRSDGKGSQISSDTVVVSDMYLYAIFELQANCYVKYNGSYVPGMMYIKSNGEYKIGQLSVKHDGVYKNPQM